MLNKKMLWGFKFQAYRLDVACDGEQGNPHNYGFDKEDDNWWYK